MVSKKSKREPRKKILKEETYQKFLTKKQLTKVEQTLLEKELFHRYCQCKKKIRMNPNYKKNSEYPLCIQSIYKNRDIQPPHNVSSKECV